MSVRQFASPEFVARDGIDRPLRALEARIAQTGWTVAGQCFELQRSAGRGPWYTAAHGLPSARQYMELVTVRAKRDRFRLVVMF